MNIFCKCKHNDAQRVNTTSSSGSVRPQDIDYENEASGKHVYHMFMQETYLTNSCYGGLCVGNIHWRNVEDYFIHCRERAVCLLGAFLSFPVNTDNSLMLICQKLSYISLFSCTQSFHGTPWKICQHSAYWITFEQLSKLSAVIGSCLSFQLIFPAITLVSWRHMRQLAVLT